MKAFLLTWNPLKWDWDTLDDDINDLNEIGTVKGRWSCGTNKSIDVGDRIFLIRLGKAPKGIMASGYTNRNVFTGPHWSNEVGKVSNYIDIDYDILINPESSKILSLDNLESQFPLQRWTTQNSGISIHQEILFDLEKLWFNFANENGHFRQLFVDSNNTQTEKSHSIFTEGNIGTVTTTKYERNPYARDVCIKKHGTICRICGFDFGKVYGEIGKGFIHIHHLMPISEIGKEYLLDPINDLCPVCPNCHAMIHKRRPAYSLEDIKGRYQKQMEQNAIFQRN
jgi:5-methylcytosine-specific restriction protein A